MPQLNQTPNSTPWCHLRIGGTVPLLLAGLLASLAMAQQPGQASFRSPEMASVALVQAAQRNDEKALLEILGPDGKQIIASGDTIEDRNDRANFVEKYQEMHRLVNEPDGSTTLYIGAKNWPTPIPIVNKDGAWYFDTLSGKQEVLFRRIGQNETSAIHLCQDLAAAQQDYFSLRQGQYAKAIFSTEGKRDGLYWKAGTGEPQSPIAPLVASVLAKGYINHQEGGPIAYCGYFFRILTRQGKQAPGGAMDYSVKGRLTKGFAIVAYPAEYRSSGVMTFIVFRDGDVLQKDLGRATVAVARVMKDYNPGPSWQKAEDRQLEASVGENPR